MMTSPPPSPTQGNSIPSASYPAQSGLRNWRIILAILLAGLIITAVTCQYIKVGVDRIAELEFASQCTDVHNKTKYRLNEHARILQSGVALFNASDRVSREEWRTFTQSQKIDQQLPGILGIGFSILIPREELTAHIQEVRSEGFPQYTIKPEGEREIYSSIIYLEPFSGRNLQAFGYDMFSERVRRSAMERARDRDYAALSGKVTLVQEIDKEVQAGTLMYAPVYRKGVPTETIEQRRAAIVGWVYSPYRMNDLMQGIFGEHNLEKEKQIRFQIFDGETPLPENLLYQSYADKGEDLLSEVRFIRQVPLDFNGTRWTLLFTKTGRCFLSLDYLPVWATMVVGSIITMLLHFLIRTLLRAHADSQRMVEERTEKLREREKLIGELQSALGEIKTLQGILPICSYCKKIRNDGGYWEQVEAYIAHHSEAEFSHSICPPCLKKHFPGEYEGIMARVQQKHNV